MFISNLSYVVHRGMKGRILGGMSAGGRYFGYRNVSIEDPNRGVQGRPAVLGYRAEIFEPEAKAVRHVFDIAGEGISLNNIAQRCNAEGLLRPEARRGCSNSPWTRSNIHNLLNNQRYVGKVVWNRMKSLISPHTGKAVVKFRPEEEWVITNIPELRIVSDDQWNRAHAGIKNIAKRSAKKSGSTPNS